MIKNSIKLSIIIAALLLSCKDSDNKTAQLTFNQDSKLKESMNRGNIVYQDFCMSCHLPNGNGVPKAFPPLAKSDYLMSDIKRSIAIVKYGQKGEIVVNGEKYNSVMTPLGLSNKEIADVMNYISNSWGNTNKALITEKEVSKIQQ